MKKTLIVVAALIVLPFALFAAERIVVLELLCRTACVHCPGAAIGADAVAENHPGEVLLVEYHLSDPFQNNESVTRAVFYSGDTVYIPAAFFDGVVKYIGPDAASNYESAFQARADSLSLLEITLEKTEDAYMSGGTLTATIKNTSEHEITGRVHFTITESNIRYSWVKDKKWVNFALRDMLPDAYGAEITLAAGADTTITRDYEINPAWPYHTDDLDNIEFGCFVQDTTVYQGRLREILQAAVIPLANPLLEGIEEKPLPISFSLKVPTLVHAHGYIELSLDATYQVNLTLYDAIGRLVKTLHAGALSAGSHLIAIEVETLPAGAYFIRASAGRHKQVSKLIILE
ncbi:hypothetical protein CEE36_05625 [candidate division TA06 bacterium B3_TA06]|uniref:Secretion system C-terminal sorting domain-containing protein n=1 Tax=candidate division TA06 bacterium B3_TA06 TaxID=2012487 RepID=A0A532V6Y7_UNCT6|nr:MAG: hypothetical protein CEE36_05625 [candidate division TA06 bacterium B3_TA06]